jgi:septal ring factor EnvC (AmiA/AmiB activator)
MLFICLSVALLVVFVAWAFVLFRMGQETSAETHLWPRVKEALSFNLFSVFGRTKDVRQEVLIGGLEQDMSADESLVQPPAGKKETLEKLLQEKNALIERLQKDLSAELAHRCEFEKVFELLQSQIQDLRIQNKKVRQEMDDLVARHARASAEPVSASAFVSRFDPDAVEDSEPALAVAASRSPRNQELSVDDVPAVLRRFIRQG